MQKKEEENNPHRALIKKELVFFRLPLKELYAWTQSPVHADANAYFIFTLICTFVS